MEIKCASDNISGFELVRLHGLQAEPNSKYVNAVEHTQSKSGFKLSFIKRFKV